MAGTVAYKDLHIDAVLQNRAVTWKNRAFIGSRICPPVPVDKASDKYAIFNKERFQWVNTQRTDKADIAIYDETFTTSTYTTKGYALGKMVSRKQRANVDAMFQRMINGVDDIREKIELDREVRIATLANLAASFNTTITIGTDQVYGVDTAPWDEYDSVFSDPERDIAYAGEVIEAATAMEPNTIILTYASARRLSQHPKIRALHKASDNALLNQRTGLPDVLFGLDVVVGLAKYSTVKKGQTITLSSIWDDDNAIIAYINPNPMIDEPAWIVGFQWGDWEVESNYIPEKKSDFISCEAPEWDEKEISDLMAVKIANIRK